MRCPSFVAYSVVLLVLCQCCLSAFAEEKKTSKAPLFSLKTMNGENYELSQNLGKGPIIINFWATWCGPCIMEMKNMKKIFEKYSPQGLQMLSIAIDDNKTQPQIPEVIRSYQFPYTMLLDGNKDIYKELHVTNVPQLFILDARGMIVYNHLGYRKGDEKNVEKIVSGLVAEKK